MIGWGFLVSSLTFQRDFIWMVSVVIYSSLLIFASTMSHWA